MSRSNDFDLIRRVLLEADPLDLYNEEDGNTDEYDSEAKAILEHLDQCTTPDELTSQIWLIFREAFTDASAGPRDRYAPIAARIWEARGKEGL